MRCNLVHCAVVLKLGLHMLLEGLRTPKFGDYCFSVSRQKLEQSPERQQRDGTTVAHFGILQLLQLPPFGLMQRQQVSKPAGSVRTTDARVNRLIARFQLIRSGHLRHNLSCKTRKL